MADTDHDEIWSEWQDLVNMPPSKLETWLDSEESKSVGDTGGKGESTGHKSGRRIVEIKHTKKADLTDDQWQWMAKTVGYIKRHLAQKPKGDVSQTDWRYSLMNWGHDPLKD